MEYSKSKSIPLQPPPSFPSLPYEIREQIWLATLTPRLVYIHPHHRLEPPPQNPEDDELTDGPLKTASVRFSHSIHSVSTTPAEAFAAYASFVVPDTPLIRKMDGDMSKYDRTLATRPLAFRSPDPPPALYVCQDSRAIAVRNGYVLAFKGVDRGLEGDDKAYWQRNHLSDKGIWINFDRDLIMLDTLNRLKMYPKCAPLQPLVLLNKWAPNEVKRIKYLALGGNPGMVLRALRGKCVPVAHGQRWRTEWQWWVSLNFDSLEEIWIDDHFEENQQEEYYYNGQWRGWHCRKGAVEQYKTTMGIGKSKLPHWTKSLPQVKVVRGIEWHGYFDG